MRIAPIIRAVPILARIVTQQCGSGYAVHHEPCLFVVPCIGTANLTYRGLP
jgi:hypothetical protein